MNSSASALVARTIPTSEVERIEDTYERIEQLKGAYDPRDLIAIYRQFATTWFVDTRNADFMRRFVTTCAENGLIDPDSAWQEYVRSVRDE